MKKLAVVILALFAPVLAHAATSPGSAYQANLSFYGTTPYYVEASTNADTPVLLASGSGYLYGVACSSGSSGDFGLPFDAVAASGITISTTGKALTPAVLSSANGVTTCTANEVCGAYRPPFGPVRFVNGLVGIKHGSNNANCIFYALTDAAIAAGTH